MKITESQLRRTIRQVISEQASSDVIAQIVPALKSPNRWGRSWDGNHMEEIIKVVKAAGGKPFSADAQFSEGQQANFSLPGGNAIEIVVGSFMGSFTQVTIYPAKVSGRGKSRRGYSATPYLGD